MNPAEDSPAKTKKSPDRSEHSMSSSPAMASPKLLDSPESSSSGHSSQNSPSGGIGSSPSQDISHKKMHPPQATVASVPPLYSGSHSAVGLFGGSSSTIVPCTPHSVPGKADTIKITSTAAYPLSAVQLDKWKTYSVFRLKCELSSGNISPDELKMALANETIFKRFTAEDLQNLALIGTQISGALLQFLQSSTIHADPTLRAMIIRAHEYNQDTRSPCRLGGF